MPIFYQIFECKCENNVVCMPNLSKKIDAQFRKSAISIIEGRRIMQ